MIGAMGDRGDANFDETVDVVVVGSGGGITGAYTAAREGMSVALLEATDKFGGTTAFSGGGGMWFPCNPVLRRKGADDTIDEALTYFHAVVGDRTPRELQDAFVRGGARLIEYLEEDDGFTFSVLPVARLLRQRTRRSHRRVAPHRRRKPLPGDALGPNADKVRGPLDNERFGSPAPDLLTGGRALIGRFLAALRRFPTATTHLDSPLTDLITEDGARRRRGHATRRRAGADRRAPRRAARRGRLRTEPGDARRVRRPREGRGHDGRDRAAPAPRTEAAMRAGADTDLMDQAWWSPGLTHPDGGSTFSLWFTGGIFVDSERTPVRQRVRGLRPDRPSDHRRIASGAMQLPFWMVFDDREGEVPPVKSTSVSMVETERYRDAGLWHTADTLEGLAQAIGVPPEVLMATVARFNELVAGGVDTDFGRGDEAYDRAFSGGEPPLVPIDRPPFHAAAFGLSDLGTKGGLRTDVHARVLDVDGRPIPGLYAAGNTMAAVSGTAYPAAVIRSARRCCSAISPHCTWRRPVTATDHRRRTSTTTIRSKLVSRRYRVRTHHMAESAFTGHAPAGWSIIGPMSYLQRYADRRVLVTGGGSGIGQATVLRILDEGGRVVAADISEAGLKDTVAKAEANGDRLSTVQMDVGDEESVKRGVADAVADAGGLDTLVNAAGILRSAHFVDTTLAEFEQVVRINLDRHLPRHSRVDTRSAPGHDAAVVNFSSTSASFAHPYMSAYAASKAGIQAMTHSLALEFSKDRIRFNCVQPGSISSGMTDGVGESKQSIGPGLPDDMDFSLLGKIMALLPLENGAMFAKPDAVASVGRDARLSRRLLGHRHRGSRRRWHPHVAAGVTRSTNTRICSVRLSHAS